MRSEKIKMIIVNAASKTLNYCKEHPAVSEEKVLEAILDQLDLKVDVKRIAVAAIVRTLKYRNEKMGDKEIMQRLLSESEEIIKGSESNNEGADEREDERSEEVENE
ncbi:MAG: hypothetical protein QW244_02465 [Candidatus Pacearchaeota archaeon]